MTDWSHTDPMVDERLVIDAAIWRGVKTALLMEATAATLVYLGYRLGGLLMMWAAQ